MATLGIGAGGVVSANPVPAAATLIASPVAPREPRRAPILLVDGGADRVLCFFGGELREIPRGPAETLDAVVAIEQEWIRRLHALEANKRHFCEAFVIYVEHTNRLTSAAEVHEALLQHAPGLVGGWTALLLLPAGEPDARALRALVDPRLRLELGTVQPVVVGPGPLLVTRSETRSSQPFAGLAELFTKYGVSHIAGVPLGTTGMLLIAERRADREFNGEDWFRLQAIARHAEGVLERIELRGRQVSEQRGARGQRPPGA